MKETTSPKEEEFSLHDCLSLGEIELGLAADKITPTAEEMHRLPILLRLLSSSRPLSRCPPLVQEEHASVRDGEGDELIDRAVRCLEDRAALYSPAEDVEVVSCHLVPHLCRKISRLRPLKKDPQTGLYQNPEMLLQHVPSSQLVGLSSSSSKRFKASDGTAVLLVQEEDDLHAQSEYDMSDEDDEGKPLGEDSNSRKRRRSTLTSNHASEDSQEATVSRILAELTSLVVQSLQAPRIEDDGDSSAVDQSLSIDDSILAESPCNAVTVEAGGAMVGSDLGATVVSLMHHAPVLRHQHVAVRS